MKKVWISVEVEVPDWLGESEMMLDLQKLLMLGETTLRTEDEEAWYAISPTGRVRIDKSQEDEACS